MADNRAQEAYDLAFRYEREIGACAQPVIKALQEVYGEKDDGAFRGLTGFSAGGANETDGICGAYAAGIFYISQRFSRSMDDLNADDTDPKAIKNLLNNLDIVKRLHDRFLEEYGSLLCQDILRKNYGRPYYIRDADEFSKFDAAGAHEWGETKVCGNAAKWTVEILESLENKE